MCERKIDIKEDDDGYKLIKNETALDKKLSKEEEKLFSKIILPLYRERNQKYVD